MKAGASVSRCLLALSGFDAWFRLVQSIHYLQLKQKQTVWVRAATTNAVISPRQRPPLWHPMAFTLAVNECLERAEVVPFPLSSLSLRGPWLMANWHVLFALLLHRGYKWWMPIVKGDWWWPRTNRFIQRNGSSLELHMCAAPTSPPPRHQTTKNVPKNCAWLSDQSAICRVFATLLRLNPVGEPHVVLLW